MAEQKRRGPYTKSAEVQRKIVDGAMKAFAELGYTATTMAEVARRAGISHNGLLHHFPTKEDLLVAVLERRDEQVAAQMASEEDAGPADDAGAALASSVHAIDPAKVSLANLILDANLSGEACVEDHPAHQALADRYATIRRYYGRLLATLESEGRLSVDVDPATLGTMFLALGEGLRHQWLYDPDGVDVAASMQAFLDLAVAPEASAAR